MTNLKAIIALAVSALGAGITAALAFQIPASPTFIYLTIATATLTPIGAYFGVYGATNRPKEPTTTGKVTP